MCENRHKPRAFQAGVEAGEKNPALRLTSMRGDKFPSVGGAQSELAKVSWAGGALPTARGVIPFPPTHSPAALLRSDKKGDCFCA